MHCESSHEPLYCNGKVVKVTAEMRITGKPLRYMRARICVVCGAVYLTKEELESTSGNTFESGELHG